MIFHTSASTIYSGALPKILFLCGAVILVILFALTVHRSPGDALADSKYVEKIRASLPNSVKRRIQRAEDIWRGSVQKRVTLLEELAEGNETLTALDSTNTIFDLFPAAFSRPHEIERVGRLGSGGKWICGMSRYELAFRQVQRKDCVVYSLGMQNTSSFEEEILWRTKCQVLAVDEAAETLQIGKQMPFLSREQQARMSFVQAGDGKGGKGALEWTLHDLLSYRNNSYIDILRLSLKPGPVFDTLNGVLADYVGGSLPIGQMVVRFHLDAEYGISELLDLWELLEQAGMRPVWSEARSRDGSVAEYTFINVQNPRNLLLLE